MRLLDWLDQLNTAAPIFVDSAFRGAIVLLIALALTYAMRRRSAAARHLVWVGAIVIQLALPLFAMWGPKWNVVVPGTVASVLPLEIPQEAGNVDATPTERAGPSVSSGRQEVVVPAVQDQRGSEGSAPISDSNEQRQTPLSGGTILIALWALGAAIVLIRLAAGTAAVASLAKRGNRVDDGSWLSLTQKLSTTLGIDRPLTLLRGTKLGVPVTWGIVYPVVLLPDDADAWTEERRRFVLVHEMAHVKRLDALTQLAGQLALALFWFDPLVWIANRRMQLEREHACDDYVIRHGTQPSTYAEELLSMVRSLGTPGHRTAQPAFAALAMARRSEFEGRMLSILDPVLDRHPLSKTRTALSAAAALLLVVPLAALHPYQRVDNLRSTAVMTAVPLRDSVAITPPKAAANDVPESFKVNMSTPTAASDTAALAKKLKDLVGTVVGKTTQQAGAAAEIHTVSGKAQSCEDVTFGAGGSTSTSIHASVHDDKAVAVDYKQLAPDKCRSAKIIGKLSYTTNEDEITGMPSGSYATFRERTADADRAVTVTPAGDGSVAHSFRSNNVSAPYDDAAKRWFAEYLPHVLVEAGLNVEARVARLKSEGGVDAVLARIGRASSSSAKRAHYMALLEADKLSAAELDKIARQAGRDLSTSSSDLRAVLQRVAPTRRGGGIQSGSTLEAAIAGITSSGDKAAVLATYGKTTDRDMLLSVMRIARTISSSGDKTNLLSQLVPYYLGGDDRTLRDAFFLTASTIQSSGDLRTLMEIVIPYASKSTDIAHRVIEISKVIASSGDRSSVLISLVEAGAVTGKELRDAFFTAANTVASDGDRARVLQAAARH